MIPFLPLCDYSPISAAESLADDDLYPAWQWAGSRVSAVLSAVVEAEQGWLGFEAAQMEMAEWRAGPARDVATLRIERTQRALRDLPTPCPLDRLAYAIAWSPVCWEWIASFLEWLPRIARLRGTGCGVLFLFRTDYGGPTVWKRNPCFDTVLGPEPSYPLRADDTGPVFLATLPEPFMTCASGWTQIAVQAHRARYWHYLKRQEAEGRPPGWGASHQKRGDSGPMPSPKWYRSWDESKLPKQRQGQILHDLLPLLYDEVP